MIQGDDGVVEGEAALRQLQVVDGGRWQSLNEVAQVVAKIPNRSTQERNR
jgi:hypothetical protein